MEDEGVAASDEQAPVAYAPEPAPGKPRRMNITRARLEKHGASVKCEGCSGGVRRPHTGACRARFERLYSFKGAAGPQPMAALGVPPPPGPDAEAGVGSASESPQAASSGPGGPSASVLSTPSEAPPAASQQGCATAGGVTTAAAAGPQHVNLAGDATAGGVRTAAAAGPRHVNSTGGATAGGVTTAAAEAAQTDSNMERFPLHARVQVVRGNYEGCAGVATKETAMKVTLTLDPDGKEVTVTKTSVAAWKGVRSMPGCRWCGATTKALPESPRRRLR